MGLCFLGVSGQGLPKFIGQASCFKSPFSSIFLCVSHIVFWGRQSSSLQDVSHDPDLQMLKFTAAQINHFFRLMHRSGFWIDDQTRQEVVRCGELWVEGYANLAARMASQRLLLFRVRPKLHMFGELVLSLYQGTTGTMNPLTTSCWADEDFIGIVSQTSRSCSRGMTGLALSFSTLQKCLGRYKIQFAKLNWEKKKAEGTAPQHLGDGIVHHGCVCISRCTGGLLWTGGSCMG